MRKKKRRIRWNNVFLFLISLICFIIFFKTSINIIKSLIDNNKIKENINTINESTKIKKINDSDKTEFFINEDDPYWKYTKMNLIDVDFNELKKINNNTVGWIQVNGTNINYPFVQTDNNNYYLSHSFNNSKNSAGWVFMDYRNDIKNFDKNSILYAHGRLDKSMFGSLRNILTNDWINNDSNYFIKLSTEFENTLWQVFSIYKTKTTNDYLEISFENDKDFLDFINMLKNRSKFNFNTNVNKTDKIITLSTCFNDKEKVVLHAKLIKREKK